MSVHKYTTRKSGEQRWIVRWRDETGKQLSRGGFRKKGEAERWERENVLAAKINGEPTPTAAGAGVSLAQWADKYFSEAMGGKSAATQDSYYSTYSSLIHSSIGGNQLDAIAQNTVIVDSWLTSLRNEGHSEANIRHGVAVLSALCTHAQRQGLIRRNPCRGLMLPQAPVSRPVAMLNTLGVELLVRELLDGPNRKGGKRRGELERARDALLVSCVAWAGTRPPSEVLALRWNDVGEKSLRIDERLYDGEIEGRVKRGAGRSTPMPEWLVDRFEAVRTLAKPSSKKDLVFPVGPNPWGMSRIRSWRRNRFYGAVKSLTERHPELAPVFEDVVPYSCRHHAISTRLAAGQPIFTVAQQAGTSVAMIEKTYGQVIAELHDSPAVSLEDQRQAALDEIANSYPLPKAG